ncbi:MAG TPA: hypothetical protein VHC18_13845 [Amycolatopsis sp.]|nr:hypothetical protein [Amycolatopsis sp.]
MRSAPSSKQDEVVPTPSGRSTIVECTTSAPTARQASARALMRPSTPRAATSPTSPSLWLCSPLTMAFWHSLMMRAARRPGSSPRTVMSSSGGS